MLWMKEMLIFIVCLFNTKNAQRGCALNGTVYSTQGKVDLTAVTVTDVIK